MRKLLLGISGIAAALVISTAASAQNTIKIGVISAFSGQFADTRRRSTTASSST